MSYRAWVYIWSVLLLGTSLSWRAYQETPVLESQGITFVVLTILATLAQLFKAEAPNHQLYYATRVFQFAGVFLLHPFLFVLLQIICHLVEWGKERLVKSPHLRNWYLQPFNISLHIICGLAARGVYTFLDANGGVFLTVSSVVAATIAVITYAVINHILVGLALVLARGVSWQDSGILDVETVLPDLINLCLGYIVAALWLINPWLIIPALSPLVLIYRALMIPQLKREAQTDPKTGLWNARYFTQLVQAELERATRFERPFSLLMADLDLLRNINNTYGHLAGDAVLAGIGAIIRQTLRDYDIAGRFGGEEFAIALPETELNKAYVIAERLREAIEAAHFEVNTSPRPLQVTMSLGVASFPRDGTALTELTHQADVAVYQAKLKGRNRVELARDVPHSVRLDEITEGQSPTKPAYPAAFASRLVTQTATPEPALPLNYTERSPAPPSLTPGLTRNRRKLFFHVFVAGTIIAGITLAVVGAGTLSSRLVLIGVFALLAVFAEFLQVDLYEVGSVSVSVTVVFAAALVAGIAGVAVVSAAIALTHYLQRRPALYKTAFNWAAHVVAGSAPALLIAMFDIALRVESLPLIIIPVGFTAITYYLIETGLIATAIGLSEGTSIIKTWHDRYRWLAGHYLVLCILGLALGVAYTALDVWGIGVFVLPVFMMRYVQKQYVERTEDSVRELRRMNIELTLANREIMAASHAMRELNDELFRTLAKIIDARDPYVSGHAAKVAEYATAAAVELGLPPERVEQVRQAAFLHDIGKIGIAEHILYKPGRLTAEEYEYIKTHAALGADFLETCRGLRHLAPFVRHHHERWDGKGYPDGLGEGSIPLEARILAVCDSVEVMASDRPYHRAMSLDEIMVELRTSAGTQFDPAITEVFVRLIEQEGTQLITNSAREVVEKHADSDNLMHYGHGWFPGIFGSAS